MRIVLFLNESYIESFDELRQVMLSHNGKSKKSKYFGKELLGLFDDGILEKWLIEHNGQQMADDLSLEMKTPNLSDNNRITIVYKIIAGIDCKIDFESEFFEMAELVGYEKKGIVLPFENKDFPKARLDDTDSEVRFVFKAIEDIEIPLYFALKKIGVYSVAGEDFSVGEPGLTATTTNTINSGDEFSVSFSIEEEDVIDRKGKYLLKLLGKKSELICELIYDVKEETFVRLIGESLGKIASLLCKLPSELVRRQLENNVEEKYVEFVNGEKVPLYHIGTLPNSYPNSCYGDFWVLLDRHFNERKMNDILRKYEPKKDDYDGTTIDWTKKNMDNLNKSVGKGSFRLLNKNELMAFSRWATFWDEFDISIGDYFVYQSGDAIKCCDVDFEDVGEPSSCCMKYYFYEERAES